MDGDVKERDRAGARASMRISRFGQAAIDCFNRTEDGGTEPENGREQKTKKRRGRPPGKAKGRDSSVQAATKAATGGNEGLPKNSGAEDGAVRGRREPTESERNDAKKLFRRIGQRFNENRKKSRAEAYAQYRYDLMENMDVLVMGGAIDLKEITTVITGLEQYTRDGGAGEGKSQSQMLAEWLRIDTKELSASPNPTEPEN